MQIPPGGLVPDDRRFGVFWLAHDRLADLLDLRGAVTDVAIRLSGQSSEAGVIRAIDRLLQPYEGRGAYGRANQPSHVMLKDHIAPLDALALVVPAIFLAVEADRRVAERFHHAGHRHGGLRLSSRHRHLHAALIRRRR